MTTTLQAEKSQTDREGGERLEEGERMRTKGRKQNNYIIIKYSFPTLKMFRSTRVE